MDNFQIIAGKMITEMEHHARKLGVKGVMGVASMDDSGFSWISQMRAVDAIKSISEILHRTSTPGITLLGLLTLKHQKWLILSWIVEASYDRLFRENLVIKAV